MITTLNGIIQKLSTFLDSLCKMIVVPLFGSIVLIFLAQITLRFLFGSSLLWYLDYIRLIYAIALYLTVPIVFKSKQHILLGVIVGKFGGLPKNILITFLHLCTLLFFVFMVYYGYTNTIESVDSKLTTIPISLAWKVAGIPIAGAVMIVHLIPHLIEDYEILIGMSHEDLSYFGRSNEQ